MTNEEAIKWLDAEIHRAEYVNVMWLDCVQVEPLMQIRKLLTAQQPKQPRVLTLEEVMEHYSLPPVFVDDLNMQEDYLQDIQPLYFEFSSNDPWNVHWRGYQHIRQYLDHWKPSYGQKWRCWTAKPTDEQREATPWGEQPKEGDGE